jgi:hypothetical protein
VIGVADFLGKVMSGINKGVAVAGTNTMGALEKSKINSIIKAQLEEKRELAEILGMKVYALSVSGSDVSSEEISEICEKMRKKDEMVEEQKKALIRVEEEITLVSGSGGGKSYGRVCRCGHANVDGSKFCAKCGCEL